MSLSGDIRSDYLQRSGNKSRRAEKLWDPSESLQVGRICRICGGLSFPAGSSGKDRERAGTLQKSSLILWLRTGIYRNTDQFPNPETQIQTEKSDLNELDSQHCFGLNS